MRHLNCGTRYIMMFIQSYWLGFTASLPIFIGGNAFGQQPCDYVLRSMNLCMPAGWSTGWFRMILMLVFWVLVLVGLVILIIRQVQVPKSEKNGCI